MYPQLTLKLPISAPNHGSPEISFTKDASGSNARSPVRSDAPCYSRSFSHRHSFSFVQTLWIHCHRTGTVRTETISGARRVHRVARWIRETRVARCSKRHHRFRDPFRIARARARHACTRYIGYRWIMVFSRTSCFRTAECTALPDPQKTPKGSKLPTGASNSWSS